METFILATCATIPERRWTERTIQVDSFQELFASALEHAMCHGGASCGIFRPYQHHMRDENIYLAEVYVCNGGSVEDFAD